ncbi:Meiotically up-regulated 190 protein [Mycena venus]|uniref:Meiotically up-regulated 190 protein n=1 Tax=Mycena venus TaxID=2733690 RepID=A0A8H7CZV1_9AGAR|nr:Meiotically up-regulated 190 protein [Mycena venus]
MSSTPGAGSSSGQRTPTPSGSRTVTDPVTHLALPVHDSTSDELLAVSPKQTPPSESPPNLDHSQMNGVVDAESRKDWGVDHARQTKIETATIVGATAFGSSFAILVLSRLLKGVMPGWTGSLFSIGMCGILGLVAPASFLYFWNPEPPRVQLHGEERQLHKSESDSPETAAWFNSLLYSLWPIVNPALFISVSDMLEDALQFAWPTLDKVQKLSVFSPFVPCRPATLPESSDDEGDFVLKTARAIPTCSWNFWLPAASYFPVWIELTGILATARMRIQLMPNPPFLSAMTLTLLGQPKVTLKCTPLAKSFLNVMDIPGLSGWLQSAIDAAVSEYVAPRSLNLDLKTLLSGHDQMDTETVGIVVVIVKSAVGFKNGDGGKFWESEAEQRGDPYATIGWGKWGKPVWSSRIIENEGSPVWEEIAVLLAGPSEMNAKEKLRVQVWDSDRGAADDLLGTVEVNLHDLMNDPKTQNQMSSRTDRFTDINGTPWPGELRWDVGYFSKTTLDQHLTEKGENVDEFKRAIEHDTERELREAESLQHDAQAEIEKQKQADLKDRSDEIIAGSPPLEEWPSGLLSINIEQIRGLVVQKTRGSVVGDDAEDEGDQDLPSAYCTVILNHTRVYKTRTKLKSNKPFFAAGTERFIKDWRTATVIIAVRDSRQHEVDPLIGVVVLPLKTVLKTRSQINDAFPLVGGIGFGRIQLSLVFRSVQAHLPKQLNGWDIGTLDIQPQARATGGNLPADLAACRLVFRTVNAKGKMRAQPGNGGGWAQKRGKPLRLAVKKRFAECLLVQFRKNSLGPDHTPAFCTLWLKDLADDEEATVALPVWRSSHGALDRARVNAEQPEGAEKVGTLEVTVKLWPGLSGYHKALAEHDANFADVMEVLDAAEENGDKDSTHDSLYDAESSSDSEDEGAEEKNEKQQGKDSILTEVKEYSKRKDELHRKHRGMMQWSAVRKLAWIGHNVEEAAEGVEQKVKGKFKHHQVEQGMDVEA